MVEETKTATGAVKADGKPPVAPAEVKPAVMKTDAAPVKKVSKKPAGVTVKKRQVLDASGKLVDMEDSEQPLEHRKKKS